MSMIQMDDPEHRKLRGLVSHAFTRKVVADLEPRIVEIAELLGVPPSDRDKYKEMVDAFFASKPDFAGGNDNTAKFEEHMGHLARMNDYIGEDLLTKLIEAEVDGERLSDAQVVERVRADRSLVPSTLESRCGCLRRSRCSAGRRRRP